MMKRTGFFLLAAGLLCLGAGCASAGKDILLSQREPIALVSVVSNWDINWKDEAPQNPNAVSFMAKRTLRGNPDMTIVSNAEELINTAERLFRETMAASPVINLAEKEKALSSRAYQEAELNKSQIDREKVNPAGYRLINYRDENFAAALAGETGIQRTMYIEYNFTKAMISGLGKNGSCEALADMTVIILDNQGKTLYKKVFSLWSMDTVKVSGGAYSQAGLMGLYDPILIELCYEFMDELSS